MVLRMFIEVLQVCPCSLWHILVLFGCVFSILLIFSLLGFSPLFGLSKGGKTKILQRSSSNTSMYNVGGTIILRAQNALCSQALNTSSKCSTCHSSTRWRGGGGGRVDPRGAWANRQMRFLGSAQPCPYKCPLPVVVL